MTFQELKVGDMFVWVPNYEMNEAYMYRKVGETAYQPNDGSFDTVEYKFTDRVLHRRVVKLFTTHKRTG